MKYKDAKKVKVGDTVLYGFPGIPKKVIEIRKHIYMTFGLNWKVVMAKCTRLLERRDRDA